MSPGETIVTGVLAGSGGKIAPVARVLETLVLLVVFSASLAVSAADAAVVDGSVPRLPAPAACLMTTSAAPARPVGLIALQENSSLTSARPVVPAAVLSDRAISGVLLYIDWSAVEPVRNRFSRVVIGAIDQAFCEAERHHKFVVLDLLPGFDSPAWALDETPPSFPSLAPCIPPQYESYSSFAFCFAYSYSGLAPARALPLPWNATYLSRWFAFLRVIAARYGRNPEFAMVGAAGPTSLSEEMSIPECPW